VVDRRGCTRPQWRSGVAANGVALSLWRRSVRRQARCDPFLEKRECRVEVLTPAESPSLGGRSGVRGKKLNQPKRNTIASFLVRGDTALPAALTLIGGVSLSVEDRDTNSRMAHFPFVQGGPQIAIGVGLRDALSERNGERTFALEVRATLQCAYEVDDIQYQMVVHTDANEKATCLARQSSLRDPPIDRSANRDTGQRAAKPSETPSR